MLGSEALNAERMMEREANAENVAPPCAGGETGTCVSIFVAKPDEMDACER